MKPRLKIPAVMTLDFESMERGQKLELDGELVKFDGEHFGHVYLKVRGRNVFLQRGDERIARLRLPT